MIALDLITVLSSSSAKMLSAVASLCVLYVDGSRLQMAEVGRAQVQAYTFWMSGAQETLKQEAQVHWTFDARWSGVGMNCTYSNSTPCHITQALAAAMQADHPMPD